MIRVYCKFCLKLVDTIEDKPIEDKPYDRTVFVYCAECKRAIGYTI